MRFYQRQRVRVEPILPQFFSVGVRKELARRQRVADAFFTDAAWLRKHVEQTERALSCQYRSRRFGLHLLLSLPLPPVEVTADCGFAIVPLKGFQQVP